MAVNPNKPLCRLAKRRRSDPLPALASRRLFGDGPTYFKSRHRIHYDVGNLDKWISYRRLELTSDGSK